MATSYKDQSWNELEASAEAKYGIPAGFLADLRLKGERSNADQVSEAGAKSVWQIIPETRNLIKTKYGVDAYAGPEQAAEAAAIVVKDAFNWAKQKTKDPEQQKALAAGFYHAGGDQSNWGARTAAYIKRVTGGQQVASAGGSGGGGGGGSMPDYSKLIEVYQSGKMAPEDAAIVEQAIKSGQIKATAQKAAATPQKSGTDALMQVYRSGRMDPADAAEFEQIMGIKKDLPGQIPGTLPQGAPAPEPSFMDKAIGAGETALTLGTGMVGGAIGMVGGAVRGVGELIVNGGYGTREGAEVIPRNAAAAASALTYQPRTKVGQDYVHEVGTAIQNVVPPVMPMLGNAGAITEGIKASAPMAVAASRRAAAPVVAAVSNANRAIEQAIPAQVAKPVGGSINAAQVEAGTLRQAKANELPVPIKLTEGQKTREFGQQQFERETAKDIDAGAPIRERMQQQQAQMRQNLDAFVDMTGAEATDLRAVGVRVNDALRSQVAAAKAKERILYKEAEKAGEMEAPVSTAPLVKFLDENASFNAPELSGATLGLVERELVRLGGAKRGPNGLIPGELALKDMELVRRGVNAAIKSKQDNATNMATGVKAKEVIDAMTEGAGGELYKRARLARAQRAKDFENVALVSNLLGTKRGSTDRAIALEDVVRKSVIEPATSLDQTRHLGVLLKKTPQGQQAWKELQGATVAHIRDEAYKGVTTDSAGNRVISPAALNRAVTNLDKSGKLDYVLGKKGAEQIRTLNEVAQDVFTAPPGSVNTSNTTSALLTSLDTLATFGTTGIPVPAMKVIAEFRKNMKTREIKKRVDEALK